MQADAEHQQNDADLGELISERDVGDEAWRRRPDQHAREEIADERREPQLGGQQPHHEREAERGGEGRQQIDAVMHLSSRERQTIE